MSDGLIQNTVLSELESDGKIIWSSCLSVWWVPAGPVEAILNFLRCWLDAHAQKGSRGGHSEHLDIIFPSEPHKDLRHGGSESKRWRGCQEYYLTFPSSPPRTRTSSIWIAETRQGRFSNYDTQFWTYLQNFPPILILNTA